MAIELQLIGHEPAVGRCVNQSALRIVQSEKFTTRTRHLRAQDAYIIEQIRFGELIKEHVKAEFQLADILTKAVQAKQLVVVANCASDSTQFAKTPSNSI